jgi:hypothetical protein
LRAIKVIVSNLKLLICEVAYHGGVVTVLLTLRMLLPVYQAGVSTH